MPSQRSMAEYRRLLMLPAPKFIYQFLRVDPFYGKDLEECRNRMEVTALVIKARKALAKIILYSKDEPCQH